MGETDTGLKRPFEDLLVEAGNHPTAGWDFSWLGKRLETEPLPWDFRRIVEKHAGGAQSMLDMGTGGGEWLASLPYRPTRTVATEAWGPNVPVAEARLRPLGVEVVKVEPAPDNVLQERHEHRGRLPFADGSFELVINRHSSFVAEGVARVLAKEGQFVTQQVGDGLHRKFRELFRSAPPDRQPWRLATATEQVERAGLTVTDSAEGQETISFSDVGALAWYLRMVPWSVPNFSIANFRDRLRELHTRIEEEGPLSVPLPGFYLVAMKR
ncbi:methyltransferase domain-containing protein [Candidatus Saccharibacteria bacterium]|nr:methyltransferase domain-containing protein [Candidatus Saccharibacteria bacterium]